MPLPPAFNLRDFEIHRVVELEQPFLPMDVMFPKATPEQLDALLPRLQPWAVDADRRMLVIVQAYLVKTPGAVMLLDTCIGCDKSIERIPEWHQRRDEGWLERLAATGTAIEDITHVLCTHLHPDHAGWNTRLLDGRWVPTFPNARYLFAETEVTACKSREPDIYRESVEPVIAAGRAELVGMDHRVSEGIWLEPTPGHTQGHVAIHLESRGQRAVMWGDLPDSPAQCVQPAWSYRRDWDGELSAVSRRSVLHACAAHDHLVLSTHFPAPSIGRIRPEGSGWWFHYEDVND